MEIRVARIFAVKIYPDVKTVYRWRYRAKLMGARSDEKE